ncbi:MAG: OsmC family protein [Nitrososphaerota archaeon]|jgi:uncharacterized OsmC-like protein|nr:OsmC family protein [Nitrososphaerota archaeon]MDG6937893.1 OsmC family protein [Nitrososphaerota archaeon]MDG6952967.1 OsmC family protein [Nitrososphaerota archaeon]MDG6956435.1 OsmC family protein [Nitrososphaerota archaeon]MDG6959587.1 OsmC family protein [Nitrososphaerota archaeon]
MDLQQNLNAVNVKELTDYVADKKANPERCNVRRTLKAEWVGGTRARVYSDSGKEIFVGGEGDFGAMSITLASLLACELDVIATHATLRGIELEKLSVEGEGGFNQARYLGIASEPRPGYTQVSYTVRIKAKNATKAQLEDLVKLCETASPVGDTLSRSVELKLNAIIE